jgi:hypothetical protein
MRRRRPTRRSTPQRGDWFEVSGEAPPAKSPAPAHSDSSEPTRAPRPPAPSLPKTASMHGGASGTEDSTRAAGYVVDLASTRAAPPGPPVKLDPALVDPPEAPREAPGGPRARRARPAPQAPAPRAEAPKKKKKPTQDEIAIERMDGESPAADVAPPQGEGTR